MKTITLPSGTYAVDSILDGFDIIEKPSSNVAFVGTSMLEHKIYVQFKNGSGYMYSEVDFDTLSFIPIAESIGKFISSKVVKHFPSEKQERTLINWIPELIIIDDPNTGQAVDEEATKNWLNKQFAGRLNRNSQTGNVTEIDLNGFPPPLLITGDISGFPEKTEPGIIFQISGDATVEYIEPDTEPKEPEF